MIAVNRRDIVKSLQQITSRLQARRIIAFIITISFTAFAPARSAAAQSPTPVPPPPTSTPVVICPVKFMDHCLFQLQLGSGWVAGIVLFILIIFSGLVWLYADPLKEWGQVQFAHIWRRLSRRSSAQSTGEDAGDLVLERRLAPLSAEEEAVFIDLESGLLDLDLSLSMELPPQPGQPGQGFREADRFNTLQEALTKADPHTNRPYEAFVLLGDPGSGKTWLLRKLSRDISQGSNPVNDDQRKPFLVALGNHKQGFVKYSSPN